MEDDWTRPWLNGATTAGLGRGRSFTVEWRLERDGGSPARHHWIVEDGRLASVVPGPVGSADLVMTSRGDLAAKSDGLVDVEDAVLNRQLEPSGSMDAFVAIESARVAVLPAMEPPSGPGVSDETLHDDEGLRAIQNELPQTALVLTQARALGLFSGMQLYISTGGTAVVDVGVGEAAPGEKMTPEHLLSWRCATKPLVAVGLARLWEADRFNLTDRVADVIGQGMLEQRCTVADVLRHRAAFVHDPPAQSVVPLQWEDLLAAVAQAQLPADWQRPAHSIYSLWTGWAVLGALTRTIDGRPLPSFLREEVFLPMGMPNSWVGIPRGNYEAYGSRVASTTDSRPGRARWQEIRDGSATCERCSPADGGRGPARELGAFYEAMSSRTAVPILTRPTVEQLLTPDLPPIGAGADRRHPWSRPLRWGLGFLRDGPSLGEHCSPEAFGHHGLENTVTLADPAYGLVIVALFNRLGEPVASARRNQLLVRAIYRDLHERILA